MQLRPDPVCNVIRVRKQPHENHDHEEETEEGRQAPERAMHASKIVLL